MTHSWEKCQTDRQADWQVDNSDFIEPSEGRGSKKNAFTSSYSGLFKPCVNHVIKYKQKSFIDFPATPRNWSFYTGELL